MDEPVRVTTIMVVPEPGFQNGFRDWGPACQGAYAILRERARDMGYPPPLAEITPVVFEDGDEYRTYLHLSDGRRFYVALREEAA